MDKKIKLLLIIVIINNVILGCTNKKENNIFENNDKEIKVGVLIYRFDDEFISSFIDSMNKYIEKINATNDIKIKVDIVDAKNQQDIQYKQIDKFIEKKYDVLAVNLVDRRNASIVIDKAKNENIPIVFFNRQPVQLDMARWDKIYYVGSKAEQSGMIQGEIVASYWNKHPEADKNGDGIMQYVLIEGQQGHQDAVLRSKYSIGMVEANNIPTEELERLTANWQRSEAKDKMATCLELYREKIEFVIANNDATALGAVDAMKESNFINEDNYIPTVGVDGIRESLEALNNKEIIGTVFNDNVNQSKGVIDIAYYLAQGKNPTEYLHDIEYGKYYWVPYAKIIAK